MSAAWAEALRGVMETCDLCRLEWPVEDLERVEWEDSTGEIWERSFCSICREREGL